MQHITCTCSFMFIVGHKPSPLLEFELKNMRTCYFYLSKYIVLARQGSRDARVFADSSMARADFRCTRLELEASCRPSCRSRATPTILRAVRFVSFLIRVSAHTADQIPVHLPHGKMGGLSCPKRLWWVRFCGYQIHDMNTVLLAKWIFKLDRGGNNMALEVVRRKYLEDKSFCPINF